jgi:uncharacterized membrane protein
VSWFALLSTKPFLKYHAVQSVLVGLPSTIVYVLLWVVFKFASSIDPDTPNIGLTFGVTMLVWFTILLGLGFVGFIVFLVMAWKAWQGRRFAVPLLGSVAERVAHLS